MEPVSYLVDSVAGGLITRATNGVLSWVARKINGYKVRRIFGVEVMSEHGFCLIYGCLTPPTRVDQNGKVVAHVFSKTGGDPQMRFSMNRAVSDCEIRAVKYVSERLAGVARISPKISSDEALQNKLDLSFVSMGMLSNQKTVDALNNPGNELVKFNDLSFVSRYGGKPLVTPLEGYDYGLVLKVHPREFPEQAWIVCGGLGEWGTSGAAWYLSRHYEEIGKWAKKEPFCVLVSVKLGQDESATCVLQARTTAEIESHAEMVSSRLTHDGPKSSD